MERVQKAIVGLLLGAALSTVAPDALAQSSSRGSSQRRHGGGNGSKTIIVPPEPLLPGSLGLLERDFQRMRATSPNPNGFMGGRWNPQYQTIRPPVQGNPGHGHGGYYTYPGYGYPGYGYPGYGSLQFGVLPYGNLPTYGSFGYPGSVVQRDVVIIQGGQTQDPGRTPATNRQNDPPATTPRPEVPRTEAPRPQTSRDDFYLKPERSTTGEGLTDALDDIRKAWLNGDFARFKTRFKTENKVRVFLKGEYKYAVESNEFLTLVKDAMERIDTLAFEFDRPKSEEAGKAFVSGQHTFLDAEKAKQSTHISYGLERVDGKWKITEVGSSSTPVTRHQN